MLSRRHALMSTLFGAGYVGLRSLATGLPASFLVNPRRALADAPLPACASSAKAQYIIMSTSGNGDPINANAPGTYDDPNISHPGDATMAKTPITLAGKSYTAAAAWATLPQAVLDRTVFWHIMTGTPVHPKEPQVLRLMDVTKSDEMLPSLLAQQLAPCLGTIQSQPIALGASSPSEGLTYSGEALPIVPPLALKATLLSPTTGALGAITSLQQTRDQTLNQLYDLYKNGATPAQQAYIDSMVTSQAQIRNISQKLLGNLGMINDNLPASQILAAVTLIQMKVAPVITIHLPFGGDNHTDNGGGVPLGNEVTQTNASIQTLASLMTMLGTATLNNAPLTDQVTFMSLNVFGRTIGPSNTHGRQHNPNHQVSITIGKPFTGGVIGGVTTFQNDYGCQGIDSKTGGGSSSGDITPAQTLASFGQTMLAAVGVDSATIATQIPLGKVITPALAA